MKIQNPHDKSFRDIFSEIEKAKELLINTLPDKISNILTWKTLIPEKDTFIDENLKDFFSDMLFSLRTKDKTPIKIYLLFEHKSYPENNIHIQLLKYLTRIYSKMNPLTPVLPLIFYHGKKKWSIPQNFIEMFNLSKQEKKLFKIYLPDFNYEIMDLNKIEIKNIIFSLTMKAILYTFKNIWDIDKSEKLDELIILSKDLFYEEEGLKIIEKLLLYIYGAKEIKPETIKKKINQLISDGKGEIAMTTEELLLRRGIKEGKVEGKREGKREGKIETAIKMLKKGFPLTDIIEITEISKEELIKLKNK